MDNLKDLLKNNKNKALSIAVATAMITTVSGSLTGCSSAYPNYEEEEEEYNNSSSSSGGFFYKGNNYSGGKDSAVDNINNDSNIKPSSEGGKSGVNKATPSKGKSGYSSSKVGSSSS